jgi:hypothetical protein
MPSREPKCEQCKRGIGPWVIKTYDPNCPGCRDKKEKGLRTGNEPLPLAGAKMTMRNYSRNAWKLRQVRVAGAAR